MLSVAEDSYNEAFITRFYDGSPISRRVWAFSQNCPHFSEIAQSRRACEVSYRFSGPGHLFSDRSRQMRLA